MFSPDVKARAELQHVSEEINHEEEFAFAQYPQLHRRLAIAEFTALPQQLAADQFWPDMGETLAERDTKTMFCDAAKDDSHPPTDTSTTLRQH